MGSRRADVMVTRYASGEHHPPHCDRRPRISVVLSGGLVEEALERTVEIGPLDIAIKSERVRHEDWFGRKGALITSAALDPDVFRGAAKHDRAVQWAWVRHQHANKLAVALLCALHARDYDDIENTALDLMASELAHASDRLHAKSPARELSRIRERLRDDVGADLSVAALARQIGVHPVHLARAYKRAYAVSIQTDRQIQRIRRGSDMLATTDQSISAIAQELGFYDQSHFTRTFKLYTAMTPARYRSQVAELVSQR
ncbi:MAG: AraC family transcriptional regulator [Caulobacterales bacterium]|nr:AraC family transcriptional regulator [Caulobacterales bacterium]